MSEIKRYTLDADKGYMDYDNYGWWVRHKDHSAEAERLKAAVRYWYGICAAEHPEKYSRDDVPEEAK